MLKSLKLLRHAGAIMTAAPAAVLTLACGSASDGDDTVRVKGIAVPGSSQHGLAMAVRNVDQSDLSTVYYYDFADGMLQRISVAASKNPGLFYSDGRVFLFNRTDQQQDFFSFDPKNLGTQPTSPVALASLAAGDPFDVTALVTGKALLLASLKGNSLQALDYTTGELTSLTDGMQFSAQPFRPLAFYRNGETLSVLSTGAQDDGTYSAGSQVFTGQLSSTGELSFDDADTASDSVVDGLIVKAANPSGFVNASGATALVVGLCPDQSAESKCTAATSRIATSARTSTTVATYEKDFKYEFVNQIVDGPDAKTVYAHVRSPDGSGAKYQVVRLDTETKAVTPVHTFPDERLYGIAYDKSTRTLLVGGQDGLTGQMILYRDDQEVGRFDLDGVLYASAAVPQ